MSCDPIWSYDTPREVTAIDISGESDIPPFVTIEVIVPDRPEKPITKRNTMNSMLPQHFELLPAYPNPFNALTKIRYALPEDAFVTLEILNLSGQKVATLVAQFQQAGFKEVMWDASAFSSGIYFYRIKAGEFSDSKRVSLLK